MMRAGMFVTANALRASVSNGIFTHFIREEDPGMISGRLDEELARLSVIASQISQGCLILFNEPAVAGRVLVVAASGRGQSAGEANRVRPAVQAYDGGGFGACSWWRPWWVQAGCTSACTGRAMSWLAVRESLAWPGQIRAA